MKKQRILIYSSFLISIFTLLGFALFYLTRQHALNDYRNRVDHSYQIILQIGKLKENILNAETGQRGYLITNDSAFLKPYTESHSNINHIFLELDSLTRSSKVQQKQLDTLKALIFTTSILLKKNLTIDKTPDEFAEEFEKGRYYMEKIKKSMDLLKEQEEVLLKEHDLKRQSTYESSAFSSYAILCIAFLICVIGVLVIIKFFNKILKYQKELRNHIYSLESLNKEIINLSFASSHNLQEPMRKIQIIIDRFEHNANPSTELIETNLIKIKQIFAKQQETNKLIIDYYAILNRPAQITKISLNLLVEELILEEKWQNQAQIHLGNLPDISVDSAQVKRLFSNLIENCITFNHDQTDLKIDVSEVPFTSISNVNLPNIQEGFRVICISDNGIGVPKELHQKIFELFQKTDDRSELAFKPGMGLSFCKRIMLNHHGWIEARNNEVKGLKIYLYFPI